MKSKEGLDLLHHGKKIFFKKNAMPVYLIHFVTEVCICAAVIASISSMRKVQDENLSNSSWTKSTE